MRIVYSRRATMSCLLALSLPIEDAASAKPVSGLDLDSSGCPASEKRRNVSVLDCLVTLARNGSFISSRIVSSDILYKCFGYGRAFRQLNASSIYLSIDPARGCTGTSWNGYIALADKRVVSLSLFLRLGPRDAFLINDAESRFSTIGKPVNPQREPVSLHQDRSVFLMRTTLPFNPDLQKVLIIRAPSALTSINLQYSASGSVYGVQVSSRRVSDHD